MSSRTHSTEVSRAWSGVQAQQQPCNKDHVVFHKRLRKQKQQEEEDVSSVNTRGRFRPRMETLLSGNNIHLKNLLNWCLSVQVWVCTHLVQQSVQHADAENSACRKGEAEHEGQVGAFVTLFLRKESPQNCKALW